MADGLRAGMDLDDAHNEPERPSLKHYLSGWYTPALVKRRNREGGNYWLAYYESMPECMAHGDSAGAAWSALENIREPYLRARYDRGHAIPHPDVYLEEAE